jgi:cell division septal protein FtsQ
MKEKKHHWADIRKNREKNKIGEKVKKYFNPIILRNILVILFLVVVLYAFVFAQFLEINEIMVKNNQSITTEKLSQFVNSEIDSKYFKLVSKRNFIFLNTRYLEKNVKNNFKKTKKVSIEKKFPNKLIVNIEERNLILSLCSRGDCYFIDENGYAYEKSNFDLADVKENRTAKLVDESGKEIREGEYVLMPKYVSFIVGIEDAIKESTSLEILNEYRTESRISEEVIVQTKKGWDIYFNSRFPIDKSVRTLKTLMNRQIMLRDLNDLEYIDLRSENKVFYRMVGGVTMEEETIKKEEEANKTLDKSEIKE